MKIKFNRMTRQITRGTALFAGALLLALGINLPECWSVTQHQIEGFHFRSCAKQICVEVRAQRAWLSQLNGAFTTEGNTNVKVSRETAASELDQIVDPHRQIDVLELSGTTATFNPKLNVLRLDDHSGDSNLISLQDGRVIGGDK